MAVGVVIEHGTGMPITGPSFNPASFAVGWFDVLGLDSDHSLGSFLV
jgi:hypothetical protein